jgi:hypothetical protein
METELIQPAVGDDWTFKLPGKRRKTKRVGSVELRWLVVGYDKSYNPTNEQILYVSWARAPKGRYSGISVRALLKYGQRISTKAERDARFKETVERRRRERAKTSTSDATN